MEGSDCGIDFIELLGTDISIKILQCLDNPSDLVRVSAVCTVWRRIVIENRLCKQLCLRMFPQLSSVCSVQAEISIARADALVEEHIVYSSLAHGLTSSKRKRLVSDTICASSTDHYYEGIENTLQPGGDRIERMLSYWSSEGLSNPEIPETLVYELASNLCVITEILVQPHQVEDFALGHPICSAKAVRFRFGRFNNLCPEQEGKATEDQIPSADNFVWTYTSPVFPMVQRKGMQIFVLPEPVLCIGGLLQIELLGAIIRHPLDGLYYICISYVEALGRHLSPVFDIDILDQSGRCTMKYNPRAKTY